MREDIAKVIVERPRTGGRGKESSTYREEVAWPRLREEQREDDSPARESIRGKKWGWNAKSFNDYLAPIVGFLRKAVGRPWDDVWSEISKHLSLGSTTQRHVLGHVRDFVVVDVIEDGGTILDAKGRPIRTSRFRAMFYVCPRARVLRAFPRTARSRGAPAPRVPVVRFHRIEGIWFEVGWARLPVLETVFVVPSADRTFVSRAALEAWLATVHARTRQLVREVERRARMFDVLVGRHAELRLGRARDRHWLDGGELYVAWKRQAGKKELRDFELRELAVDHGGPAVEV